MEWGNLAQMTIISTTVGKNPLEEMEQCSQSTKESKMQYVCAISKMTEWSLFVFKENQHITVVQVYAPTTSDKEADIERFYEDI